MSYSSTISLLTKAFISQRLFAEWAKERDRLTLYTLHLENRDRAPALIPSNHIRWWELFTHFARRSLTPHPNTGARAPPQVEPPTILRPSYFGGTPQGISRMWLGAFAIFNYQHIHTRFWNLSRTRQSALCNSWEPIVGDITESINRITMCLYHWHWWGNFLSMVNHRKNAINCNRHCTCPTLTHNSSHTGGCSKTNLSKDIAK